MEKRKLGPAMSLVLCIALVCLFWGCGMVETNTPKIKDLEYEILEEKDIPQEFLAAMEEKKEAGFKLTYGQGIPIHSYGVWRPGNRRIQHFRK